VHTRTIAIIGGTGNEGKGLAYRWAKAGHQIIIGSREHEKAERAVKEIQEFSSIPLNISGKENTAASRLAEIIVLTVPFSAHEKTLETIKKFAQGKIIIDVTVPLVPPRVTRVQMPPEGSALMQAKQILGDNVRVSSAFQNVSHELLFKDHEIECDVLVCGEDKEVRSLVLDLVKDAGMTGWDAGPIENSMVVEGLTSVLIGLNVKYKVHSAGIRITGITKEDQ
jgi:NADPH-dependent F420 reductase